MQFDTHHVTGFYRVLPFVCHPNTHTHTHTNTANVSRRYIFLICWIFYFYEFVVRYYHLFDCLFYSRSFLSLSLSLSVLLPFFSSTYPLHPLLRCSFDCHWLVSSAGKAVLALNKGLQRSVFSLIAKQTRVGFSSLLFFSSCFVFGCFFRCVLSASFTFHVCVPEIWILWLFALISRWVSFSSVVCNESNSIPGLSCR